MAAFQFVSEVRQILQSISILPKAFLSTVTRRTPMTETSMLSAGSLTELKDLTSLLNKTRDMIYSKEDSPQEDYFSTKDKALGYVYDGYTILPSVYHSVFVEPLK